jgi:hypothetical protein
MKKVHIFEPDCSFIQFDLISENLLLTILSRSLLFLNMMLNQHHEKINFITEQIDFSPIFIMQLSILTDPGLQKFWLICISWEHME